MKTFALFSLLLASSTVALPSPPLPPQLLDVSQEEGGSNLRGGRGLQTTNSTCTPSIEVSVELGDCFGIGQTITVKVTTCPTPFPEWIGIFPESPTNFDAANNWLYCCGDQVCATPVAPSTYTLTFGFESAGSAAWPLADSFGGGGGTYKIFFHTGIGTASTISIKVTPGYFCDGPYAGVPVALIPPEFTPCPLVNYTQPCFEDSSMSSDSEDGGSGGGDDQGEDENGEPCVKITPGQGGTPPGQGGIPPGLQCKDKLPPGIAKKQNGN